jgi:adenosylhomocysteine nucleosidase
MEGGAIAHVAYVNSVRCVIIRSISDNADGSAEIDFPEFTRAAAEVSTAVTTALVQKL